jgi:WD40 repeat protein
MVTGGQDTNVKIWDNRSPDPVATFKCLSGSITRLAISPNGQLIAAGSDTGEIRVSQAVHDGSDTPAASKLCAATNNLSLRLMPPPAAHFLPAARRTTVTLTQAFPPGLTSTASHAPLTISTRCTPLQLYDVKANKEMHRYNHNNAVTGLAFHPKEYAMVSSSTDKTLKFVDLDQPGNAHTSPVDAHPLRAITFDQEGGHIFAANSEMLKVSRLLVCSVQEPTPAISCLLAAHCRSVCCIMPETHVARTTCCYRVQ